MMTDQDDDPIRTWADVEKRSARIHAEREARDALERPAREAEERRARRQGELGAWFKFVGLMTMYALIAWALIKLFHLG